MNFASFSRSASITIAIRHNDYTIDDKWTIEQMKRDRFQGIPLSSFEHLSPVWQPESIDRIKELEMDLHSNRNFITEIDVAS
jgi:hypothetical protein